MCYWRISHHSISFFKSGIILRKALIVLDCFSVRIRQHHVQIGDTREVGFLQLCVEKGGTGRYLRTIKSVFWGVKCWNWCSWRKRSFSLKLALLNTHASSRLAHILAARLCWHSSGHIWCFCSVVQPKQAEKMVASEEAKRRLLVSSFRESGILAQGRWSWRHQNWFFSWGFPLILHLQMKHIVFSRDVGTQSARVAFRVLCYQVGLGTGGNDQTIENSYSSRTSEWKHVQEFGLDPHLH